MTEYIENDASKWKNIISHQIRNAPKEKWKDLSRTIWINRLGSIGQHVKKQHLETRYSVTTEMSYLKMMADSTGFENFEGE